MSEEKKDFVVKDRRFFSEDNQDSKEQVPEESDDNKESQEKEAPKEEAPKSDSADEQETGPPLPEINFPTFIFSLNSSALIQLGLLEDISTGGKIKNLPLAKQTIDILGMLEEKTRGNLTNEEENMLKNILYELRMLYVKAKE
ncbi:MAG: DUF1844 domain-containing protein [Desulfobacteraceae bacterium]|nr:DUF1844 domain-containing protein [Desulfobacteraceae bacterium]